MRLSYDGAFSLGGEALAFEHTQPKAEITFDSTALADPADRLFYS
ncbi:hypothetical protein AB7M37_005621 [Sinorhizobium fredii]